MVSRIFASIRTKLLAFFLISCLIPVLILGFVSWYHYQRTINGNTLVYNQQIMSLSAAKLEDFLNKLDQFYYAVYSKNLNTSLSRIEESSTEGVKATLSLTDTISSLRAYYGLSHTLSYLSIVSSDGTIIYQNDLALTTDYSFRKASWFTEFMDSEKSTCLSPPERLPYHESRYTSGTAQYMAYARKIPCYDQTRRSYVFLMEFDSGQISTLLSPLIKGSLGNLLLYSGNTQLYALMETPISQNDLAAFLTSEEEHRITKVNGTSYLLNQYPLNHSSLTIISINSMEELMQDVPSLMKFTLFLISLSFLLSLLFAQFFSGQLTRPIQKLKAVTFDVMQGDLNVTIPALPRDEIGDLGKCIDQMLSHIRQLIQDKYQYSLREKEMQIRTLQSQINPHFLYNTLETISSIAESEGVDQISDIALSMADLYRYSIRSFDRLVPISDELSHIHNYLNIMKVRYGQRICTHFHVDPGTAEFFIMKLTLQPLIENAIYHGLESKRTEGNLYVAVREEGDFIRISIEDDGAGISTEKLSALQKQLKAPLSEPFHDSSHIGILNVCQRLKLRFGESCSMDIQSSPGAGTTVIILLPQVREEAPDIPQSHNQTNLLSHDQQ